MESRTLTGCQIKGPARRRDRPEYIVSESMAAGAISIPYGSVVTNYSSPADLRRI